MTIFKQNPLTKEINEFKRKKVCREFPFLIDCGHESYLSLFKFLFNIPEKFYSRKAYTDILKFLEDLKKNDNINLIKFFKKYKDSLFFSFEQLNEINLLDFHDNALPKDDISLILFFKKYIEPHYLKLVEGVYSNLILPISSYKSNERDIIVDTFPLNSRIERLRSIEKYKYLTETYNRIIRNGIAHGKVKYNQLEIVFEDDKGNTFSASPEYLVKSFDYLLDICNGLSLGLRVFFYKNIDFLQKSSIRIPIPIVIDEIIAETSGPGWKITNYLEYEKDNKKQLYIYTENTFLDYLKLIYYIYRSAIVAEELAPSYDNYIIMLESKYFLSGIVIFNGNKLEKKRLNKIKISEDYLETIESSIIPPPKIKLPNIFFRISNIVSATKTLYPIYFGVFKEDNSPISILPRKTKINRVRFYSELQCDIVIKQNIEKPIEALIRENLYIILKKVKKEAKKSKKIFNIFKFLIIKFLAVRIYSMDLRIRKLGTGFIPELICIIELKKGSRLPVDKIDGLEEETIGKYRVIWNRIGKKY